MTRKYVRKKPTKQAEYFTKVLALVKEGYTVIDSCKALKIRSGNLYRYLSEQQKAELIAHRKFNKQNLLTIDPENL
ncbi:MAG: hypothetical protein IT245_07050 [Bacteroidia bacterium]|nr:hypothetical protein [Bacteroidia bacterium]